MRFETKMVEHIVNYYSLSVESLKTSLAFIKLTKILLSNLTSHI